MNAHQRRVARRARRARKVALNAKFGSLLKFTPEQLAEIRESLRAVFKMPAGYGDHARDYDSGGYYG